MPEPTNQPALFASIAQADETPVPTAPSRSRILRQHFFRRFFDNDTVSIDGETQTAVIRALAFCAIPSLMFAFWLMPNYPNRTVFDVLSDRYFFVLYSFVTMGAVTTFEWEMLFPDRSDFLILLTLPLKARELFVAKSSALILFLGMFLIAANLFAAILYPAVCTRVYINSRIHLNPLLYLGGHFSAVMLAGLCSDFIMLAIQGMLISLLPPSWFRPVSTFVQSLSIAVLGLLFLLYPLISRNLPTLLSGSIPFARFVPPLWFIALYEELCDGDFTTPGMASLANTGLYATAFAALLCFITYPLGWARQQKRALEGATTTRNHSRGALAAVLHRTILPRPQQRAIFHFIGQTITRNPRYQVYLAIYAGAGLALALCSILDLKHTRTSTLTLTLSSGGLHAILPLLLFWLVVGLRASFAFPVDMRARWVFPINLALSPASRQSLPELSQYPGPGYPGPDAKSAKLWTLLCCALLTASVLALLLALHWSWTGLLIQAICGAGLSILLADLFFLGRTQIPFTRPRLPGRAGLPLVLTLYAALFPAMVLLTVYLELSAETQLKPLLYILLGIPALHLILKKTDQLAQAGIIGGFPEDETDPGPQTLGLFQ